MKRRQVLTEFLELSAGAAADDPRLRMFVREWALDKETGGQLPDASGRAFAVWLDNNWNEWTEDEEATVKSVLEGAVSDWCGGRSF